jgi:hypothetical protein
MDDTLRAMIDQLLEGTPLGEILRLRDQARDAARSQLWHRSAELFAECIARCTALGGEMNGLLVQSLDERAAVLRRAGLDDEVKACEAHALRLRSEHVSGLLAGQDDRTRTARQRLLVRAILPGFVPFLDIGLTGGGLVYFERAPYAVVLKAANRLGFDFFRRRVGELSGSSYLDLLERCHPHASETTFGGYLVLPPRDDARLSLTSLSTLWADRLGPLVREVDEVLGPRSHGSSVRMSWR